MIMKDVKGGLTTIMNKSLLLVNDVTGYGRVSCFAMTPILAAYGLHPYLLPTGLVSNTLDYGMSEILDTTDFMRAAVSKWRKLGFSFNTIATGFINSDEQVDIILDLIDSQDNPFVLVDPIMADSGELYDNMYPGAIECNRKLASRADVIIPNFTEAAMLAGLYTDRFCLSNEEYIELAAEVSKLGCKKLVITSCRSYDGRMFNLVYDCLAGDKYDFLYYDEIEDSFIGTGDVFSAVLISELMCGASLPAAVERAGEFVADVITANLGREDHFDLYIEGCVARLCENRFTL